MLNNVSIGLGVISRNVVINHPNTFNCKLYHQEIIRRTPTVFGGEPTLGGMGVLDEDDEVDYEYHFAGNGYALPAENFAESPLVDRNDANIGPKAEFYFLIEPEAQAGEPDFFTVSTHDVLLLCLGTEADCAKLAFEVVSRLTKTNIPPYNAVYICNRRNDLDIAKGGKLLAEIRHSV